MSRGAMLLLNERSRNVVGVMPSEAALWLNVFDIAFAHT